LSRDGGWFTGTSWRRIGQFSYPELFQPLHGDGKFEVTCLCPERHRGLAEGEDCVWLFDSVTGHLIGRRLPLRQEGEDRSRFSRDGRIVLVNCAPDFGTQLYDTATGAPIGGPFRGVGGEFFTPDGRELIVHRSEHVAGADGAAERNTLKRIALRPVEGTATRLTLWVHVVLGKELTASGEVQALDQDDLLRRWHELDEHHEGVPLPSRLAEPGR
jgi:hypothetical protein